MLNTSIKNWAEDDRPREKLLQKGYSALSNAELLAILINNGTKEQSAVGVAKELQFDKVMDTLIHVDLLELVGDKKVVATLPIKFTGVSIGVKEGGKLITKIKSLKVKALPADLRENIEVDITNLGLNGNIRVEDVNTPNIEVLNSPRIPIASVVLTRQLKQEEASAPKAAAKAPAKAAAPAKGAAAPAKGAAKK